MPWYKTLHALKLAPSHLPGTTSNAGYAGTTADAAERLKAASCEVLLQIHPVPPTSYHFVAFGDVTLGPCSSNPMLSPPSET